jgi:hypothetical protein
MLPPSIRGGERKLKKPQKKFEDPFSTVSNSHRKQLEMRGGFSIHCTEVEPQLVCTERELPADIEQQIRQGFFELKQKFSEEGPSSIYISHVVLQQKHPIFMKCEMETLKRLLIESSIVYLNKDQILYRHGSQ